MVVALVLAISLKGRRQRHAVYSQSVCLGTILAKDIVVGKP